MNVFKGIEGVDGGEIGVLGEVGVTSDRKYWGKYGI